MPYNAGVSSETIHSPVPGRCRRTNLAAGVTVATLVVLVVLRVIWGGIAQQRLDEQLELAKGDPLTPEALYPAEDPAGADNAVPLIEEAQASVDPGVDSLAMSNLEYADHPPFPPAWHRLANAALASPRNLEALRLTREARSRKRFHWNIRVTSPLFKNLPTRSFNKSRNLANLLGDASLHAHLKGDDVEAIERIRDVRHLSAAVAPQKMLIAHLVSIGIDALALHRLEVIAPGLKLGRQDHAPLRRQVRSLIDELLDEREAGQSLRHAFVGERVLQIEIMRWDTRGVWAIRPMYELDLARMLKADLALISASTQPTLPAAKSLLSELLSRSGDSFSAFNLTQQPDRDPPRFSRQLSTMLLPSLERVIETDMRVRTERRMAAVSLAAQLYRADHRRWPASLDALVPGYLPRVPIDPLAEGNRPLGYLLVQNGRPDGDARPIVYSVGPDGKDATGTSPALPDKPQYGWMGTRGKPDDQYRDLSRWRSPEPPPATRESDDATTPDVDDL